MSGEQLERSILERKERDELHAIAEAMSLKPGARSKKADIIDQILQATGIDVGSAAGNGNGNGRAHTTETAERPTRARRSNGTAPEPAEAAAEAPAEEPPAKARRTRKSTKVDDAAEPQTLDGIAAPAPAPRGRASKAARTVVAAGNPAENAAEPQSEDARSEAPAAAATSAEAEAERVEHGASEPQGDTASSGDGDRGEPSANGTSSAVAPQRFPQRQAPGGAQRQDQNQRQDQTQRQDQNGGDPGNRRSRRRRGRDRERPATGSEMQGPPQEASWQGELVPVKGLLDLREEGYGFLRTGGYLPSPRDVYVSVSQARRFAMRRGDAIEGACRPAGPSEKYPALIRIDTICGLPVDEARQRARFEDLTPLFPDERLALEIPGDPANITARIVDLISPIGKGQRGMMVSPPKAGKTTVMKQIAHSIEQNNPDVHLMVLLVDERPEEATDWRRSVKGEVIASTFDRPAEEHVAVAELSIERAKRLVELGRDVVIILDGITRLARAYNLGQPATGRIMSGGVDSGALYPPKKFFGAARNIEEGGSLTIIATALVETGSRMDEVIFEEFKGTGNMELRLDRKLSERRIYPAIDVNASSTRHEELLFERGQLQQVWKLRRVLNALGNEGNAAAGLELLVDKIRSTRSNNEFLAEIAKAPTPGA
jgi:transcription termination factor Rho